MAIYVLYPEPEVEFPSEEDYAQWAEEDANNGEDPIEGAVDSTGGYDDLTKFVDVADHEVND